MIQPIANTDYSTRLNSLKDELFSKVSALLNQSGTIIRGSGSLALDITPEGKISVIGNIENRDELTSIFNGDEKLKMLLRTASKSQSFENKSTLSSPAYILELNGNTPTEYPPTYDKIFTPDCFAKLNHADLPARNVQLPENVLAEKIDWAEAFKQATSYQDCNVSSAYSLVNRRENSGTAYYDGSMSLAYAARRSRSTTASGLNGTVQERDLFATVSQTRQSVFAAVEAALKDAGIILKAGDKLDFIADEKGKIRVGESVSDKKLAAQIEAVINGDENLGRSITDLLARSAAKTAVDPATLRLQIDGLMREYAGMGVDDLQWNADGFFTPTAGIQNLISEYAGIANYLADLKYLATANGAEIFKKDFKFSLTASGIIDTKMSHRAQANLFSDAIKDVSITWENGASPLAMNNLKRTTSSHEDFSKLQELFNDAGTSVYLAAVGDN